MDKISWGELNLAMGDVIAKFEDVETKIRTTRERNKLHKLTNRLKLVESELMNFKTK